MNAKNEGRSSHSKRGKTSSNNLLTLVITTVTITLPGRQTIKEKGKSNIFAKGASQLQTGGAHYAAV
jgi:hypothetical protein